MLIYVIRSWITITLVRSHLVWLMWQFVGNKMGTYTYSNRMYACIKYRQNVNTSN